MKGPKAFTMQDVKDAALGRLIRNMPRGYSLLRGDVEHEQWFYAKDSLHINEYDTPEEALSGKYDY